MSFQINTDYLARIRCYADAVRKEETTIPIRGSTLKPLGKRTAKHMQIIRSGDVIKCRFYHTDCVSYYPDGRIHIHHAGYTTVSTAEFISAVSPVFAYTKDGHLMVSCGGAYKVPSDGLWLKDGVVQDPELFEVHTLKRGVIKELRGRYKVLLDRAVAMCMLSEGRTPNSGRGVINELPEVFDEDDGELVIALMVKSSEPGYDRNTNTYVTRTTPSRIKNTLDDLIMRQYRDMLFETETVPAGEYKKDRYGKYF